MPFVKTSPRDREIVEQSVAIIADHLHPRRIFLFGSRARGTAGAGADFDFAVECESAISADTERAVRDLLQTVAGLHSVDLVFLDRVDARFRELVMQGGELVYDREHGRLRLGAV